MEKFAVEKNKRISIYKGILQQKPTYFLPQLTEEERWK